MTDAKMNAVRQIEDRHVVEAEHFLRNLSEGEPDTAGAWRTWPLQLDGYRVTLDAISADELLTWAASESQDTRAGMDALVEKMRPGETLGEYVSREQVDTGHP